MAVHAEKARLSLPVSARSRKNLFSIINREARRRGELPENGSLLGRDGSGASPVFRTGADRQNCPEILRYAAETREAACSRSVQDAVFLRANNPLRPGCALDRRLEKFFSSRPKFSVVGERVQNMNTGPAEADVAYLPVNAPGRMVSCS
jgi:hypothetical protein